MLYHLHICISRSHLKLMTYFQKYLDHQGTIVGARIAQWYSTRLQTGCSGVWVLAGAGNFSLFPFRLALVPSQPPIQWVPRDLSIGVKQPRCEADRSPPTSAEVKECMELYLHSPIRLHGVLLRVLLYHIYIYIYIFSFEMNHFIYDSFLKKLKQIM
jgi:hypothetical protein